MKKHVAKYLLSSKNKEMKALLPLVASKQLKGDS